MHSYAKFVVAAFLMLAGFNLFAEEPQAEELQEISKPLVGSVSSETEAEDLSKLLELSIKNSSPEKNYLIASTADKPVFSFNKVRPTEYSLIIRDSKLAEGLQDQLVAPKGSGKIRAVRVSLNDSDLVLNIMTEPDTLLKAQGKDGSILVTALNDRVDWSQVRAQAEEAPVAAETPSQEAESAPSPSDSVAAQPETDAQASETPTTEEVAANDEEASLEEIERSIDSQFETKYSGRLISLDLQDTDIDNALRIIAEVSNLNIIASDDVAGKVTLRLIDVPWDQALDVILKTNGLDMVKEGTVVRIAPVEKLRAEREALKQATLAKDELEPLKVHYVRVSYAKSSELQPLVESVLTERGSVAFDERTNQLIVKDIAKGLQNVQKLIEKLDLRTPQVLIESQIVEATRTFTRSFGSQLGFSFDRTPANGNALPYNFPNSVQVGGSALDAEGASAGDGVASNYPGTATSAVSMLFGSADGSKSLSLRLSQAESEGVAKVISRPSVAVTNNTPAIIKSVQKIRIKLPQGGGISIGVGAGSSGSGGGSVATETIEVGIVLNVTAQASPDYFVLMDIDAKSSTLGNKTEGVDGIPPEIERSATSSVLVSSGQTFAMGGIYRIDENNDVQGMPFFKDIPVFGHFFRSSSLRDGDQELLFFLTPRIIEGSFDDAAMQAAS